MEHLQHGMKRKWERHFNESSRLISIFLFMIGICCVIILTFLWPQYYTPLSFNSRLAYQLIIDVDDYWTCNSKYDAFVTDEPSQEIQLQTFYVFNITNTLQVIQRGFKPDIVETGPYGYRKHTYRYDVNFDPKDSTTITFKEFNTLEPLSDYKACKRMFYRMDKNNLLDGDPCLTRQCECQDPHGVVTIINPLFLKLLYQEGSHQMIARYSAEIFTTIDGYMRNEFVEAVKAHLVPNALEEIYVFRRFIQEFTMFSTAYDYIENSLNHDYDTMASQFLASNYRDYEPDQCGLDAYGISSGCPWAAGDSFSYIRTRSGDLTKYFTNVTDGDVPSAVPILNISSTISFRHESIGFPKWLMAMVYINYAEFPFAKSTAMMTTDEIKDNYMKLKHDIAAYTFGSSPTRNQLLGAELLMYAISLHFRDRWRVAYVSTITSMVYTEWRDTYEPVTCAVTGETCVWQWGAVQRETGSPYTMTNELIFSLIDRGAKVNTNPNSLYYDGNAASIHNSYRYCHSIILPNIEPTSCMDIDYAETGATLTFPAGLASIDDNINQINNTLVLVNFKKKTQEQKNVYIYLGCNISTLIHDIYRTSTDFHDQFVIRYINKYKNENFTHTFSVDKWDELGYAQWGGGFVTEAIVGVLSTINIKRDGMWYFGKFDYYRALIEFSSWTIKYGYPYSKLWNVTDSQVLLQALSRDDEVGVEFRRYIMYQSTTLVGNGIDYYNGIGDIGEIAFTNENSQVNFTCSGDNQAACKVLNVAFASSGDQCTFIQNSIYGTCLQLIKKRNNWATECSRFETSITSPLQGIQCDASYVFGDAHPYIKKRGVIVSKMMFSLAIEIVLKLGLWCPNYDNCRYTRSGLFTTTTAQRLLFEGYADASVNKYLSLKYRDQIKFQCVEESYDACGTQNFHCNQAGLYINTTSESLHMRYGTTPKEKYFVSDLYVASDGKLLWPFDKNKTIATESRSIMASDTVTRILNPFWTAFPAWDSGDLEYQRYLQCQGRYFQGPAELFNSCEDTLNTGRLDLSQIHEIITYRGNNSMSLLLTNDRMMDVNGSSLLQAKPFLWAGFPEYAYSYLGATKGPEFYTVKNPVLFNKQYALRLELAQTELEEWDQTRPISAIFQSQFDWNITTSKIVTSRRFSENQQTWDNVRSLGTPKDSNGMDYRIPTAMFSLERLAGFPLFIGTPHNYGNERWGGFEYQHVTNSAPDVQAQMTFADYDPITGKIMRRAFRHQFNVRVERNSLLSILFSSQGRCVAPTKTFTASTGYGCFSYVPVFWAEESRIMTAAEFESLWDHFYTRPDRAQVIMIIGAIFGLIFTFVSGVLYLEDWRKYRKFKKRIYID